MAGIRRRFGSPPRRARPLLTDDIRRAVDALDRDTVVGALHAVILLLGFASALRSEELVALDVEDLTESADGLEEDYDTGIVSLPIPQYHLLELSGIRDASTLQKHRSQLVAWRLIEFTARRGLVGRYGIQSWWARGFVFDAQAAVPVGIARDERLSVQSRALYCVLSLLGERGRQRAWPRDADGNLPDDETPMYPTRCALDRVEVRKLVGFKRRDQLDRWLAELTDCGHIALTGRGPTVELLTSVAAEAERQRHEAAEMAKW